MTKSKTFPKEGQKKDKQTIRDLKAIVRKLEKEVEFLNREIENIVKPIRDRKVHVDQSKLSYDSWRQDFVKRYKVMREDS